MPQEENSQYFNSIFSIQKSEPHRHRLDTNESPNDGIGEGELKKAFEQIANCIHLDDIFSHDSPTKVSGVIGTPMTVSQSPCHRSRRTPNVDTALMINSPAPLSSKSFLDDDWLKERVKHDSKMAQVAGGLVRTSSTTPPSEAFTVFQANASNGMMRGGNSTPPGDYICKLCAIPGHWLKDCHLYEHRGSHYIRSSIAQNRNSSTISSSILKSQLPPGNYVCRLCGIPGHWIEQCAKFQPKRDLLKGGGCGNNSLLPPKNYICNLCHQPGHWIQHCPEFTPMLSPHRARSTSMERNGRYF